MSKNVQTVTAANLRDYFRAKPERMALLSPEAVATVEPGARGKVHAEAVKVHNRRRPTRQYVTGASKAAAQAEREAAKALRAQAVKAGHAGTRGPLPKAFLGQSKG